MPSNVVRDMSLFLSGAISFDRPIYWDTTSQKDRFVFGADGEWKRNTGANTKVTWPPPLLFYTRKELVDAVDAWCSGKFPRSAFDKDPLQWTQAVNKPHLNKTEHISNWDVTHVIDFSRLFMSKSYFDDPIGTWNTQSATTIKDIFSGASAFSCDISQWLSLIHI